MHGHVTRRAAVDVGAGERASPPPHPPELNVLNRVYAAADTASAAVNVSAGQPAHPPELAVLNRAYAAADRVSYARCGGGP